MALTITNRDRYPGSTFLSAAEIKPFVEVDSNIYLLVGYEDGDKDTPLVARQPTDGSEELHATPMYELLKFAQGTIRELT